MMKKLKRYLIGGIELNRSYVLLLGLFFKRN